MAGGGVLMGKVVINTEDVADLVSSVLTDCAALDGLDYSDSVSDSWYYSESIKRALLNFASIADSAEKVR